MKKKPTKILSLLLSLMILVSMMPAAYAQEAAEESVSDEIISDEQMAEVAAEEPVLLAEEESSDTVIEPEILFYRDFEDYEGGKNTLNNGYHYGSFNFTSNSNPFDTAVSVEGTDGIGFEVNKDGGPGRYTLPEALNTGKIYLALDVATKTDEALEAQDGNKTTKHSNFVYFRSSDSKTSKYIYFATHHSTYNSGVGDWQKIYNTYISKDTHRLEAIVDLDSDTYYVYENGIQKSTGTYSTDIGQIRMTLTKGIGYLDNFTIIHYPADVQEQTFSVASEGEGDSALDVLRVKLRSDAYDSDALVKRTTDDTSDDAYSAPYGITLPTADDTNAKYYLENDIFEVRDSEGNDVEISEITRGKKSGEYIIKLEKDVQCNQQYTVTANSALTDILGATLNPANVCAEITVGEDLSAEVKKSGADVVVEFSDEIDNAIAYRTGAAVKNAYTGETVSAKLTKTDDNTAKISDCTLVEGYEYIITIPSDIRAKNGNTISENVIRFNLAQTNAVKKLSLVDVQGKEHDISDLNMPGLHSLKLEFTSDVTASEVLGGMTITDKDNKAVDFTASCNDNIGEAVLTKILTGDNIYTISISGLSVEYAITLKTSPAKLEQLPAMWLDADGNELTTLEGVESGDVVKVRLDFVNSTDEPASFVASACLFNGLAMKGFDFEEINLQSTAQGTGKHTSTFTFTVGDISNGLKLKSFMWSEAGVSAPLADESVLE